MHRVNLLHGESLLLLYGVLRRDSRRGRYGAGHRAKTFYRGVPRDGRGGNDGASDCYMEMQAELIETEMEAELIETEMEAELTTFWELTETPIASPKNKSIYVLIMSCLHAVNNIQQNYA